MVWGAQYDESLRGEHALGERMSHSITMECHAELSLWYRDRQDPRVGQDVVQAPGECLRLALMSAAHCQNGVSRFRFLQQSFAAQ